MTESTSTRDIVMPQLDLPGITATLSVWLTAVGATVVAGDRVLEIAAGEVVVDLSAPVTGVLSERLVSEDEPVKAGQVLGRVAQQAE